MPYLRHLAVALALVAGTACSNSVDLSDPKVIAVELSLYGSVWYSSATLTADPVTATFRRTSR
jgi:hypothetical protein